MKSISMIKEEFKNLTPEQIPAQIALYQEDERKGVQCEGKNDFKCAYRQLTTQ